jgi:hypothetical protein
VRSSPLGVGVGVAVSAVCLWLALRDVDLARIIDTLGGARPGYLALGVGSVVLASLTGAYRWKMLFHPDQAELRVGTLWSITQVGQALNIALPARVGEIARVVLLSGRSRRGTVETAATIALEKLLDLLMVALIAAAVLVAIPLPELGPAARGVLATVGAIGAGAVLLLVLYRRTLVSRLDQAPAVRRGFAWSMVARLRPGLDRLDRMGSARVLGPAVLASAIVWMASALVNYLVIAAVGIDVPPLAAFVTLAVLQLGTAVPSAPGKIGVYEYLCVLALAPFGVGRGAAVGFGVTLHLVAYAPPLLVGGVLAARWLGELRRGGALGGDTPE